MRGHIYKPKGGASWYYIVDVGRDPQTGKRKMRKKGGFRTRKEAERALAELISQVHRGGYVEPSKLTTGEYLATWLAHHRLDLKPSTIPGYEIAVERLTERLGTLRLQELRAFHLTALYDELRANGRRQRPGGLSPRYVRYIHSVMRAALNHAVEDGLLESNPALRAKPPKAETARRDARQSRKFLTLDETRTFLAAIRGHRLQAAFHLTVTTGMRRGEVLGLRWRDLDLDNGRLTIEQTLVAPRYVLTVCEPKSESGRRTVDLDGGTVAVLRAHRRRQIEERIAAGPGYLDSELLFSDPVFRNEDGSHVRPALFSLAMAAAAKAAGLGKLRPKDCRNSHVALLGAAGEHPQVVSERVGHADVAFTLSEYGATFAQQHREAVDRFGALVGGEQ